MKNKGFIRIVILIMGVFFIAFSSTFVAEATTPKKKDLMVSSLENLNTVYVDQKAEYSVSISSIDPTNPQKSMQPYNQANVTVYFKNSDNKLMKSKPISKGKGRYVGSVTLPDAGTWDVLVLALRHGEKEAADESNVYTLPTQWAVHTPKGHSAEWEIGVGLAGIGVVSYFFIRRTRRKNRSKRKEL